MTRHTVELTSLDKLLFPADGITKGDLVDYYRSVAPYILPYLRDRPINLERFPNGIGQPGFFQQAMPPHYPAWIASLEVEKENGSVRHVVVRNPATLVYLANQNCVTLHAWLSRARRLDHPDQMIFDLDPPDDAGEAIRDAARMLGGLLRERRRATGGEALTARYRWDVAADAIREACAAAAAERRRGGR